MIERKIGAGRSVFFTDDADLAREMIQSGEAVIGMLDWNGKDQDWSNVPYLIAQNVWEVEDWYLEEAWCRCHGQPIVIGTIRDGQKAYRLREMRPEEIGKLYTLYEDSAIKRWIPPLDSDVSVEKAKASAYVKYQYEIYGCGIWVLEEETSGAFVGRIGVETDWCEGEVRFFLGYLTAPSIRGHGIARQACQLALDYVKMRQDPQEIWCKIACGNIASQKLAERLGFVCQKEEDGQMLWKMEEKKD